MMGMKARKIISMVLVMAGILSLTACGGEKTEIPTVQISLWCDKTCIPMLQEQLNVYKELHKKEVNYDFVVSAEGEDTCKTTVLQNPKGAADIYTFVDDQMDELYQNKTLHEITKNKETVMAAAGGENASVVQAAVRDGKLYAYPYMSGNGYYLYYNKKYFKKNDIKELDHILEIAAKNKKKFTMDYSSGWYIFSFFKGAGLDVKGNPDGKTNECNWNATDTENKGIDVVKAMLSIASHEGFVALEDDGFVKNVENGTVIAGVNGPWNASKVEKAWGENYATAKLPTYTLNGKQVQMNSIQGFKLMGINAYTKYPEECMELVEYLTNAENQLKRFELTGECPANPKAAENEEVQKSPAIAALGEQSKYGHSRNLADTFWNASRKMGIILASGNRDKKDLQSLLDETQKEIVANEVTSQDEAEKADEK